jgi:hypothetical protein
MIRNEDRLGAERAMLLDGEAWAVACWHVIRRHRASCPDCANRATRSNCLSGRDLARFLFPWRDPSRHRAKADASLDRTSRQYRAKDRATAASPFKGEGRRPARNDSAIG